VATASDLYEFDTTSRSIERSIPIPAATTTSLTQLESQSNDAAFTPDLRFAYVANGAGQLLPVDLSSGAVGTPIAVPEADSVAIVGTNAWVSGPDGLWLVDLSTGAVLVYDAIANTAGESLSPDGRTLYVYSNSDQGIGAALCQVLSTSSTTTPSEPNNSPVTCPPPPAPSPIRPTVSIPANEAEPAIIAINAETGQVEWNVVAGVEPAAVEVTKTTVWIAGTGDGGDALVIPVDIRTHEQGRAIVVEVPSQFPLFRLSAWVPIVALFVAILVVSDLVAVVIVLLWRKRPDAPSDDVWFTGESP